MADEPEKRPPLNFDDLLGDTALCNDKKAARRRVWRRRLWRDLRRKEREGLFDNLLPRRSADAPAEDDG